MGNEDFSKSSHPVITRAAINSSKFSQRIIIYFVPKSLFTTTVPKKMTTLNLSYPFPCKWLFCIMLVCTWRNQTYPEGYRWAENGVDFFCSSEMQRVRSGCYLEAGHVRCTGAFTGLFQGPLTIETPIVSQGLSGTYFFCCLEKHAPSSYFCLRPRWDLWTSKNKFSALP